MSTFASASTCATVPIRSPSQLSTAVPSFSIRYEVGSPRSMVVSIAPRAAGETLRRVVYGEVVLRTADTPIEQELESYRRALTGYCYRMIGSGAEAEDAVQETMVRAWKSADKLEARGALKAWLFKIAGNVCLDMLQSAQRRAQPMDMGPSANADAPLGAMLADSAYVRPIADAKVLPETADPAELAAERETLRLAFVAALQHLPAKQRAVLILREVLRWQASEVAELLDTSVASVNSALQRARATIEELHLDTSGPVTVAADQQELLANYVKAFEAWDMKSIVALLKEDASFSMPP